MVETKILNHLNKSQVTRKFVFIFDERSLNQLIKMRNFYFLSIFIAFSMISGCTIQNKDADLLVYNGRIYTVDSSGQVADAMAVKNGKVLAIGTSSALFREYDFKDTLDLQGGFVFPGFIDAHCHFFGYALSLQYIDLKGSSSFEEVLSRLEQAGKQKPDSWIVGRGWDQNIWPVKVFPDNQRLNQLFPENPVLLIRIDGHVVLANEAALKAAGMERFSTFQPGEVLMKNGKPTGILSENAADRIRDMVPVPQGDQLAALLRQAESNCLNAGLTGVSDAGLDYDRVMLIDSLQKKGVLKIFVNAWLTPNPVNLEKFVAKGPYLTECLSVRSIKIYADGSLGSRTARLKRPYSDDPSTSGVIVTSPDSVLKLCRLAYDHGYQINTHCIGDSAVAMILDLYSRFLKGKNDLRWRIEHAQIVDPRDFHLFGEYSIIPSIQGTHATSDMKWAERRVGSLRMEGAYAYRTLLAQNGWIANGTDFPIEHIDPVMTFYATVSRKDREGNPEQGFYPEEGLSRTDALRSMTIWAAKAGFSEKVKGSLETGKDADFVILDRDLMEVSERDIPETRIVGTFIHGQRVK